MGVDLSSLLERNERELSQFKGRAVAVDAYNALYQFLSTIRQPDGEPLMDRQGRVTSHLSGLFYRTARLLEMGIKPVYVFDGVPHPLKRATLEARRLHREKAREEWEAALEAGDTETARVKAQQSSVLTRDMVHEATRLLEAMGVPVVEAPSEGEAQASYMARSGRVWAAASQDYDSLLFGAPRLVRNLTLSGRRKLPRKQVYITVHPEYIELQAVLDTLGVTREQLIDIGILVGTDFNPGVRGIGPKTALKLIKKHGTLEEVMKHRNLTIEHYQEIREIFLRPQVVEDVQLRWGTVDTDAVVEILCTEHDFSRERVQRTLSTLSQALQDASQSRLDAFF